MYAICLTTNGTGAVSAAAPNNAAGIACIRGVADSGGSLMASVWIGAPTDGASGGYRIAHLQCAAFSTDTVSFDPDVVNLSPGENTIWAVFFDSNANHEIWVYVK